MGRREFDGIQVSCSASNTSDDRCKRASSFLAISGKDKNVTFRDLAKTIDGTPGRRIAFLDGQLYVANRPET
jgi:hypothetical protein